jgi:hypothetical protein
LRLKMLLKRGGLLAAANWPVIAVQFVAQTTFQMLLAVPLVGAAFLAAVMLGADLGNLLQGTLRQMFTTITAALMSEPAALAAFVAAIALVVVGGSILMFLVKGGTVDVMIAADRAAAPVETEPLGMTTLAAASAFTVSRFINGSERLFRRYLALGLSLMAVYAASGAAYLAFVIYGYRHAGTGGVIVSWTVAAAAAAVGLVVWVTAVNLLYLLLQIVIAAEDVGVFDAVRAVGRFVRQDAVDLGGVFLVVSGMVVVATLASALAWSGVALIAFVPLVGLAVVPIQILALLIRGLLFQYIGVMAMGSYVTIHRRHLARAALAAQAPLSPAHPVSRVPGA